MSKLPREWKELSLEDICIPKGIRRGPFGGALKKDIFVPNGYKVYEQKNAISKDLSLGQYFITEEKYNEMEAFQVKENDFLISCSGTIGKIVQIPNNYKQGIINQALLKLTLNNFVINDTFFKYQFESDKIQSLIVDNTQGGAMPNLVGMSIFKNTKFIIPPLQEQNKIADILSTVDKKIAFVEENINATEELKKGLMQKLLTEGIGHTEFKDSELGTIPESWEVIKIEDITELVTKGTTPTTLGYQYESSGINFIKIESIDKNGNFDKSSFAYISEVENDLLYSIAGALGRVAIVNKSILPANTNQALSIIRLKDKSNVKYIYFYLNSPYIKNHIDKVNVQNAQANLSLQHIKNFKIAMPPLEEQKQIAEILSTVDKKLENLKEKKLFFQELKKGLMQKLLTGEVRV
jgi:type I restriction enzyme, S subunit